MQSIKQLRISTVDGALSTALPEFKMLCPDAVIFEETDGAGELIDEMCGDALHRMIIVVCPQTDTMNVYWRKSCWAASVDELERVITELNW